MPVPGNAISRRRLRCSAAVLPAVLAVLVVLAGLGLAGACSPDDDSRSPIRPARLPPTTIAEHAPPPTIDEPLRPVEPLPPPEAGQP